MKNEKQQNKLKHNKSSKLLNGLLAILSKTNFMLPDHGNNYVKLNKNILF